VRGVGGHNLEKYFIGLFHVSEHLGHFKAIKKKSENNGNFWSGVPPPPPPPSLVKDQTISVFFS
jgi:hypothetical protein